MLVRRYVGTYVRMHVCVWSHVRWPLQGASWSTFALLKGS